MKTSSFARLVCCGVMKGIALGNLIAVLSPGTLTAHEHTGEQIYRQQCATCHGVHGEGDKVKYPRALTGKRSLSELARFIGRRMPKDDPGTCVGEDARKVAAYIFESFYSPDAQACHRPPRIELSRLTVRQFRNAVADLIDSLRTTDQNSSDDLGKRKHKNSPQHGLRGTYYKLKLDKTDRVFQRIDPDIRFDFGKASPDPNNEAFTEDRRLLEEHATFVRVMEQELQATHGQKRSYTIPKLKAGVKRGKVAMADKGNGDMPQMTKMQIDLLVSSFVADFARVATLQFTMANGNTGMPWLGITDSHHELSHSEHKDKLIQYDKWYCSQLAYLAQQLAKTPEPGRGGSLLDNTMIVWTNEMAEGWHSKGNLPFVLVGNGMNFRMGRLMECGGVPHNRVWLSLAYGMGYEIKGFGEPELCEESALTDLT